MTIEFEDIVPRRDYKLKIDWKCHDCLPEFQEKKVHLIGKSLPGEYSSDQKIITWDDIVHIKCQFNHVTRPKRRCSRCGNIVPFDALKCPPCDERVKNILNYEEQLNELIEEIRKARRKKEDVEERLQQAENLKLQLAYLGVHACVDCGFIWINIDESRCKECAEYGE